LKRPWALPLVPLYAAGLAVKHGLVRPERLRGRVVSVGSLSAGGAGKTPVVMLVVEMLRSAGFEVDVLSRGYGRTGKGVERVDPAGDAGRFGDEPMLLARRLGVPVWVGGSRFQAGVAAEAAFDWEKPLVHVLDDGFQHRKLGRDVDVVVLTRAEVEDGLLPAGDLREGLGALGRADVVVLREEEAEGLRGLVPAGKAVWVVRRGISFAGWVPERPVVFCGIARPEGLVGMLAGVGVSGVEVVRFGDHHRYGMGDVRRLIDVARRVGADGFVTTEKDGVKLTGEMLEGLGGIGPAVVAELGVELVEGGVGDLISGWDALAGIKDKTDAGSLRE
jgi:tetraacyldisaccharide 4'-kinase